MRAEMESIDGARPARARLGGSWKLALKIGFGIALLAVLLLQVDPREFVATLRATDPWIFLWAVVVAAIGNALRTWKWKVLLDALDARVGFNRLHAVTYMALFDVENADQELRAEMTAQVSFICARSQDAIAVPLAALQAADSSHGRSTDTDPRLHQVRLLNSDGTTSIRDIATGVRSRRFVEVKSGVSVGERVIVGEAGQAFPSSFRVER